ncbi:glycosyltransferase family 39 protein, partial [bacterium]|nr:glycosyltransferase family 39 protein [bacterium]
MKPDKDILSRVFPGVPDSARRTLVIIMLIGLALRLMAAYLQPAFYDEGHTYNFTKCGFSAIITEMLRDSHPPTYNLLIYPLVQLSDSIFVLRLPGVLAGTLAIFFGFMLGKRLGGECCGLLTAAVMAGVYNLWLLDAQLRSYGLLDCALLALLLMVIKIYETGRPISLLVKPSVNWAVFTLTAILAASLHATGTLAVLCYLILLAILPVREEMPSRRLPCALLGAALLPPLGWGLYVKAQASSYLSQAHALGSNLREFLDLPAYLLGWQVYP